MLITFILVAIGWIFFRSTTISDAFAFIQNIFNPTVLDSVLLVKGLNINILLIFILIMALFEWFNRNREFGFEISKWNIVVRHILYWALLFAIVVYIAENESFIYFQF